MSEETNIAETIAREVSKPILIDAGSNTHIAVPKNYSLTNLESLMPTPKRKRGNVTLQDSDSFVAYVLDQGSIAQSTIWCDADYSAGKVKLTSILNDHGLDAASPHWRDHVANYSPAFSGEWNRWFKNNKQVFSQAEFAQFLEENNKDIAGVENSPSGIQMLEMALNFEANQEMRFKSAMRLQNGAVQINFVQNDDDQTLTKMQMFDKFNIGIPVFWSGSAYRIEARLRYRARDGKVQFWFELIRADKVIEDATVDLIDKIRAATGFRFFNGNPSA